MSRKKHDTPPQWIRPVEPLSGKNGYFGRIYNDLLEAPNFQKLSYGSKYLYITMIVVSTGKKEFTLTSSEAEKRGISKGSFRRLIDELLLAGFIQIKESGRLTRTPNKYEFMLNYTMVQKEKEQN